MRIAFLVDQFPSLSETFILNQITGLLDRGHEVDIYSDLQGDTTKVHPDVERYKLLDRTYYTGMPPGRIRRILAIPALIFTNFYDHPLVLGRALNMFKYQFSEYGEQAVLLRLFYSAIPFLNKQSYDIIHCHYGRNGIRGLMLRDIGALQGPLVTTFHGFDISNYLHKYGEHIYVRLFEGGDLFQPISELWKRRLLELGCPEQKIAVHRMGIDFTKFSCRPPKPGDNDCVQILTIGRLVEKKGVEYAIRAIAQLGKSRNIQYQIVGDGPLREYLEDLIIQLDISARVKFVGWKQQSEVLDLLQQVDILLAPSVTSQEGDREGIPVTLMEGMATGLPVVSTLHSGIPELIQDGISGFLVPERDVDALAQKLAYLIDHPEVGLKMGRAGRAYVEKHYNINHLNDCLVDIYQKLIEVVK